MQYTVELLELWWSCLMAAMRDQSLAFPISVFVGLVLGALFWWLAALSARLWNRRFHLKPALQILCGCAALLAVVFAMTVVSAKNIEKAIINSTNQWKDHLLSDANVEWRSEAFYRAWDAVADTKSQPTVTRSNNPRVTNENRELSMTDADAKQAVVITYVDASRENFQTAHPFLNSILLSDKTNDIPKERMNQSIVDWFRANDTAYPVSIAISLLVDHIVGVAKSEAQAAAEHTRRISIAMFLATQLLVFLVIAIVAQRSNRPVTELN